LKIVGNPFFCAISSPNLFFPLSLLILPHFYTVGFLISSPLPAFSRNSSPSCPSIANGMPFSFKTLLLFKRSCQLSSPPSLRTSSFANTSLAFSQILRRSTTFFFYPLLIASPPPQRDRSEELAHCRKHFFFPLPTQYRMARPLPRPIPPILCGVL